MYGYGVLGVDCLLRRQVAFGMLQWSARDYKCGPWQMPVLFESLIAESNGLCVGNCCIHVGSDQTKMQATLATPPLPRADSLERPALFSVSPKQLCPALQSCRSIAGIWDIRWAGKEVGASWDNGTCRICLARPVYLARSGSMRLCMLSAPMGILIG